MATHPALSQQAANVGVSLPTDGGIQLPLPVVCEPARLLHRRRSLAHATFPGSRTVSYEYDAQGRRTAITYPGGSDEVTYAYDAASRLTTVTDWNSDATSYSYDDANRLVGVDLPNGVETTYAYDDGNRLTGIEHVLGMSTLASVDYTLDAVGNRTQRVDGAGTHTYVYDDLYRLTSATYPGPSTTTYAFDAFGNRTSMTEGMDTTTYAYDDADRLETVTPPSPASPISYTWDDNGNLTDRGADEFVWDFEDHLVEATVNSVTTSFTYSGGLRQSRTVGMDTTTFTWDIAMGIPQVLDDGDRYVYGAHGRISQVTATDEYYYLTDGQGSVLAVCDDIGTVLASLEYDVYGRVSGGMGTFDSEFNFAGEQFDADLGLQYLRARYYDFESGTFISSDPLARLTRSTMNPYLYSSGNPTTLTDPTGLLSCRDWAGWIPGDLCAQWDKYRGRTNAAERAWCEDLKYGIFPRFERIDQCVFVYQLAEYIEDEVMPAVFGDELASDDFGEPNGVRHCLWIGTAAMRYGGEVARGFGRRHEQDANGPYDRISMVDLKNNEIGIVVGLLVATEYGTPGPWDDYSGQFNAVLETCVNLALGGALNTLKSGIWP